MLGILGGRTAYLSPPLFQIDTLEKASGSGRQELKIKTLQHEMEWR